MATLQVLSNSRIKNRCLNYDETIIMKMREDFVNYVDPDILLLHLHILSTEDEKRIDAEQKREGRSSAARLLLQLLPHYPEWLPRLLESLLHPDVRLEHLAQKIKQSLEEVMMDIDIDEDNAMEVDLDSPPPGDIGELSSLLIPEDLGLHAQRWNVEQLAQYITSVQQQIAKEFFNIFFSTVNQMIQEMVDTFRERERLDMTVTSFANDCLEILFRLKSPHDVQKLRELLQTGALYQALEGTVLTGERQLWLVQEAKKYGLQWRRPNLKITISEEHLQRCEQYLASKHDSSLLSVDKGSMKQEEGQQYYLKVTELPTQVTEQELRNYFQDRKQCGGGPVERVVFNSQENMAAIYFTDSDVVNRVMSRAPLLMKGKKICVDVGSSSHQEESQEEICTVEVRGLDEKSVEIISLYFENPRKGGGDIKEKCWDDNKKVLYLTFNDAKVAERLANSSHTVAGKVLTVTLHQPQLEENSDQCTVEVRGFDPDNRDIYQLYFENRRKGGGEIVDLLMNEDKSIMYITFKSPEVAETVCNRQHTICGHKVEVTLHKPQVSVLRQKSREERKEQEEAKPRTIQVTVGQQIQSQDLYLFYFENKRLGGGEVEKVEIVKEKGLVFVTFVSPEAAQQIAGRQHIINGQKVEVKLYIPPKPRPTYPNKLLIQNVKESTTRDCLSMFLESITGLEPEEIIYGDKVGVVLVSFTEQPDFKKVQDICQKRRLEGNRLTVSKVPISNCLLVEKLNPKTSEDTISLYFENKKRSLGGAVERIEMLPGENKCLVYFEDHEVIDGVLTKTHIIDQKQLTVKHFMECLGPSGGSPDGNIFIVPKPLALKDVDSSKIAFVRQSSTAKEYFIRQISLSHGLPKFVENTVTVECTLTSSVPNARTLVRTWPQDVQQAVNKYMDLLDVHRLEIMHETWLEVEKAIKSITMKNKDAAVCFMQPQDKTILVVGIKIMARNLFEQISKTVKDIEEEVDRKTREIKETNKNLKTFQLRLLAAMSFQTEAEKRHEHLKIEIRSKKREITFHGLLKEVKEAQIEMIGLLQQVKSDKIPEMSPLQKVLLNSQETCTLLINKFKTEKIVAVWDQEQEVVSVYAFSDNDVVKAVHIIRKSVVQHIIPLTVESAHLLHSKKWDGLVKTMVDAHSGKLNITPSQDNQQIFITGCDDILHGVTEKIQCFMQENTIYTEVYRFSPSRQKFVSMYWKNELFSLSVPLSNLKAYKVQVTMDKKGEGICVMATEKGLQLMKTKLQELGEKIICHTESMSEPAKIKFLSSDNCTKDLDILGRSNQCVVALTEESNELQEFQSDYEQVGMQSFGNSPVAIKPANQQSRKFSEPEITSGNTTITGYTSPREIQTSSSLNLKLYVYAANQLNVQGFLTAFGEFVTNKFTRKEINDEALTWMNVDQSSSHIHFKLQSEESERKQFPNKTSSSKRKRQRYYGMVERGTVLNECPKLEEEGLNEFLEETTTNSFLPPFISDSWQMTSEFSSKGGQMQEQNSDVVLYVPENAIESSSSVTIRTAVSTNLQRVHELFGLDSEEMIVSPVAEFTVKPNIPFKKSVWVILPHFLTQPYSPEHVNVYRFQNKILERLQFEPKDKRTAVSEGNQRDGFSVVKDGKICIFSSHFTGFFCTQCKRQLEPDQLYLRAYGQYTQRDKREVKLLLFVWDGRLHIKDFEKYILIGREKAYEVQKSGLLDAAPKDPKVCLGIEFLMQDNIRNFWNFTEMDGHQLFPPTTTRNLEYILCQKHLQKRARSKRDEEFPLCCYKREPLRIEWALDERPGCMPSKWFQCAIRVGYSTTFDPEPLNFLENARIETLHVNELELKEARNSFSQTESCETHESRAARPSSIPSFNEGFQPSSLQTMIPLPHYTINNIRVNRLNGQVIAANENVQHSISATLLQDNMNALSLAEPVLEIESPHIQPDFKNGN